MLVLLINELALLLAALFPFLQPSDDHLGIGGSFSQLLAVALLDSTDADLLHVYISVELEALP